MRVTIRQIGDSQAVVIPRSLLAQVELHGALSAELSIEGGALVLRKAERPVRAGWSEAAIEIAEDGDDKLVMGEFGNEGDLELKW